VPAVSHIVLTNVVLPSIFSFFFVFALIATAIGIGLVIASDATFAIFGFMNRYVSTRKATKQMAIPRDTSGAVMRHRRWFAAFFVFGAAFAEFGLITRVHDVQVVNLVKLAMPRAAALWLLDSARWILIVGSFFSIILGLLLAFSPAAVAALERRANRWYSTRKMGAGAEAMNFSFDNWVRAFPRVSGLLLFFPALALALYLGVWLFTRG
jgi:hypothetical protein